MATIDINNILPAKISSTMFNSSTFDVGDLKITARSTATAGWLMCQGQAVSRTTYSALFSAIGTSYGTGDGSTTFNVPNMCGNVPVGLNSSDTDFNALGKTIGEKKHTLTVDEMPSHSHISNYPISGRDMSTGWVASGGGTAYNPPTLTATISNSGGGQTHNNMQPSIVVNYMIFAGV